LQSANVAQAPHAPLTQAVPFWHPTGGLQPAFGSVGVQIPPWHVSPDAQSVLIEQVH
jgi:hypothetical protein